MQAKLRRYQEMSRTSGFGVLVFCIWSIVKAVMIMVLQQDSSMSTAADTIDPELQAQLETMFEEVTEGIGSLVLLLGLFLLLVVLDLIFRIYVGKSAMAVAKGKKERAILPEKTRRCLA